MSLQTKSSPHKKQIKLERPVGLAQTVYGEMLDLLVSLEIPPNSRINIEALARQLGVSQTPIREALGRLEEQGLVVKSHNIGYTAAAQLDAKRFSDLYDLRMQLEPEAAARAARHITSDELAQLAELDSSMRECEARHDTYSRFASLDAKFHDAILLIAGNSLVHELYGRIHVHMHLFRLRYHARVTTAAVREHDELLAALAERSEDQARSAMKRHIEMSYKRFASAFDDLDDKFMLRDSVKREGR